MESDELQVLSIGDRASVTGELVQEGSVHRIIMRAEGQYGEILNPKDPPVFSLRVKGLNEPPLGSMVTVRGIWTGDAIERATASDGGRGIETPNRVESTSFPDVQGTSQRADIAPDTLKPALDALMGGALVAFLAVRGPRGWFGLASATDVDAVHEALNPILGAHLHVVASEWSRPEVRDAQRSVSAVSDPCLTGLFWDDKGRFRAEIVVEHISRELASVVTQLPADILHVATWLRREEADEQPSPDKEMNR